MSLINEVYDSGSITRDELAVFSILLNPFAPHVTEEVWRACSCLLYTSDAADE